jgi:toxin ParE1/3/4
VTPRVHQTARARADLLAIWLDVAVEDAAAADRLFDRLEARVRILETFAEAGRSRPDIAPDARVLVERPYLILYRLVPGGVQVVRVLHGARHVDGLLFAAGME